MRPTVPKSTATMAALVGPKLPKRPVFAASGTTLIDGAYSLAVYNGSLYAGTYESASAEVYRYDGGTTWVKVSQAAGTIKSSGTGSIDRAHSMVVYNNGLYVGTNKSASAEVYRFDAIEGQSYSLKFGAASDAAGSTEQTGYPNEGSIGFLAEQQARGGANTGTFLFSHGIATTSGAYDLAEDYPTRDDSLVPGDLVSIDQNEQGLVKKTADPSDPTILGVYSEKPGLRLSQTGDKIDGARAIPVALAGRVPVNVTTENGPIVPGDYLTSSSTPGYAMKATEPGPTIGKALSGFGGGDSTDQTGRVTAFLNISYYMPSAAELLQDSSGNNNDLVSLASLTITNQLTTAQLTVTGSTHFLGSLTLEGHIIAAADTAGTITIEAGHSQATYAFTTPYAQIPKVVVSPNVNVGPLRWWVIETNDNFSLYLPAPLPPIPPLII